jgi:hypothetical protein
VCSGAGGDVGGRWTWHHADVKTARKPARTPSANKGKPAPTKKPAAKRATKPAAKPAAKRAANPAAVRGAPARRATSPISKPVSEIGEAPPRPARRMDFGASTEDFFARQLPPLREVLETLRAMIDEAAPDAESSLKWGMPFYTVGGGMMCALGGHKTHVNLILSGPPEAFPDPDGRLAGDGKTGRHLKLRSLEELPRQAVRGWLRAAAERARKKA